MFEIIAAAALVLAIALVQPAMSRFRSPLVLPLLCLAWLFPAMFVGHIIRTNLVAKLMSHPVQGMDHNGLDSPTQSASEMISSLMRLALSPVVVVKAVFQGFIGLLDGCMHIDLGNSRSHHRKPPSDRS